MSLLLKLLLSFIGRRRIWVQDRDAPGWVQERLVGLICSLFAHFFYRKINHDIVSWAVV